MFEPGQKVMVVESSLGKKTGPRIGSIGYVSDMEFFYWGVRFKRIIWSRFGYGKRRMETQPFVFIPKGSTMPLLPRIHRSRVSGKIIPIQDQRLHVNELSHEDFTCWMYSAMRIFPEDLESCRIRVNYGLTNMRPSSFNVSKSVDRKIYLEAAREIKSIWFKAMDKLLEYNYNRCNMHMNAYFSGRYALRYATPPMMAERVVIKRCGGFDDFFTFFYMAEFSNIIGKKYLDKIHQHPFLLSTYSKWKKEVLMSK